MARRTSAQNKRTKRTKRTSQRRHRFGDQNAPAATVTNPMNGERKIRRQDTPLELTLDSEGNFAKPNPDMPLSKEKAHRLGVLEAEYARDLAQMKARGVEDTQALERLKERYKRARWSVFTPNDVYQASEDLEGFAANDLYAQRSENERRTTAAREAAEHQTMLWKIKSAFNKLIGRSNAFGKTSKRTGRKKKYAKKTRHGFNGYHNPDH
jgi:hypothetical protein